MAFTGKAIYCSGGVVPDITEDVADFVSIVSPYKTPLFNHLGDLIRPATSTYHEWLKDKPCGCNVETVAVA